MAQDALINTFDFSQYGDAEFLSLWVHQIEKGISDFERIGWRPKAEKGQGQPINRYATYLNRSLAIIQHLSAEYQEDLRYFIAWRSFWQDTASIDLARYICALYRMYKTRNLEYIRYFVSEERYELYKREFKMLESYGLRKEIDFQFFDDIPESPETIRQIDGKNETFSPAHYGSFKETYYNENDEVVFENIVEKASIRLYMYRAKFTEMIRETKAQSCLNCGAPIQHELGKYHCPYCHTDYDGEAAVWVATELWIVDEKARVKALHAEKKKQKSPILKRIKDKFLDFVGGVLAPIFSLAAIIMAFVDFENVFSGYDMKTPAFLLPPYKYIPLFLLFLPLILGLLSVIILGIYAYFLQKNNPDKDLVDGVTSVIANSLKIEKTIADNDQNFSINSLRRHLDALGVSEALCSKHLKSGEELLSSSAPLIVLRRKYFKEYPRGRKAEMVDLDYQLPMLAVSLRGGHLQFRKADIKDRISLVRDAGIKTPFYKKPSQFTCPSCGSHSRLKEGEWQSCSYCGNKLELRTIDWQVAEM